MGGGIAGLAAATALAERGVAVTVLEREATLGGRVRSWPTADGRTMSRGFHAFFRQYYNLRSLLRRADPALAHLQPVPDYPLLAADGDRDSFTHVPRTPPWSFIGFVALSPSFSAADLARVHLPTALEMLDVDFPASYARYDGESAAQFLDRLRFPARARHLALEVFARSFFADPAQFSAGELVAMFHSYFLGSAEGLLFDVPDDDYDTALWQPMQRHLERLGVTVRTGTSVTDVHSGPDGVTVRGDGVDLGADAVVLALDPGSLRTLVRASAGLGAAQWRAQMDSIAVAPPFGVSRRWLDRPVDAGRPAFTGTTGFGDLDNISVLERFETGARDWRGRHGGSVVEVHAYAQAPATDQADLQRRLWTQAARVMPELGPAVPVAEEWLWREDCWLLDTRPWQERVAVTTPDPRVVLAGDGLRCDLPCALMERAATTGFQAGNALLASWGLPGHELWSVPTAGRHAHVGRLRAAVTR